METLNLDLLPDEAKREIINYYQKLLKEIKEQKKYESWKFNRDEIYEERFNNSKLGKKMRLEEYFGKFKFKPIKFDREEANAR